MVVVYVHKYTRHAVDRENAVVFLPNLVLMFYNDAFKGANSGPVSLGDGVVE